MANKLKKHLTIDDVEAAIVSSVLEWGRLNTKALAARDNILKTANIDRARKLAVKADHIRELEINARGRLFKLAKCLDLIKLVDSEEYS